MTFISLKPQHPFPYTAWVRFIKIVARQVTQSVVVLLLAGLPTYASAQTTSGDAGAGATLFASGCMAAGCHTAGPSASLNASALNAANAGGQIDYARGNAMGNGTIAAFTQAQFNDIAAYIATFVPNPNPVSVAIPFNSPGVAITIPNIRFNSTFGDLSILSTVAAPAKGAVSYSIVGTVGTVTYTPTIGQSGADSFTYKAAGGLGNETNTRTITVSIQGAAPIVTSAATATGTAGQAFSYQVTASNAPASFSASGLPAGVSINTSTGLISGTPTVSGSFASTVSATNPSGTGNLALAITINLVAPVITSAASASGGGGQAFNFQVTASNLAASFAATGLPAGLSINTTSGLISGTPSATGTFNVALSATNTAGTGNQTLVLTIALLAPVITSSASANVTAGSPFSYQITANNLPASFAATGLPAGLGINTTTGLISGTPTAVASTTAMITVSATNASGTGNLVVAISISASAPVVSSAATAAGTVGQAFSYQITASNFPTSFSATGLPPGLSVNTATGLISGTPTTLGSFNAAVTANNGAGSANQVVVITIALLAPAITSAATASGTVQQSFSYQIVASNGPTSFAATSLPAGLTINPATGLISGTPSAAGAFTVSLSATNVTGTATLAAVFTIANLPAPSVSSQSLSVAFNTAGTIDLASAVFGSVSAVAIASPPANGTVTLAGTVVTYTPRAGYFGPDSFTFTATGTGGTSAPATVSITVATPPAPQSSARTLAVPFSGTATLDLAAAASGVFTRVSLVTAPQNGSATLAGNIVTYVARAGFFGADSFTYVVVGPGGTSAPATVAVTVATQPPAGSAVTFVLPLNTPTTLDLTPFVTGSAISGVTITKHPTHGTVSVSGLRVTFVPTRDYFGADSFSYVVFGVAGTSPSAAVRVSVVGRPNPAKDSNVVGLVDAQAESAQRFAKAQISNVQSRLESLHRRPESASVETDPRNRVASLADKAALATASDNNTRTSIEPRVGFTPAMAYADTPAKASFAEATAPFPFSAQVAQLLVNRSINLASAASSTAVATRGSSGGLAGFWMAGDARFGARGATSERGTLDFSTNGISIGVDRHMTEKLALGIALGVARDKTRIGGDGSETKASGGSVTGYGSYQIGRTGFVDGLIGIGTLDFSSQRWVAPLSEFARGDRRGTQLFGSLAAGYEHRDNGLLFSPYGRLDFSRDALKQNTESGAGAYALTYDNQSTTALNAAIGLRAESVHEASFGYATPRVRAEYQHVLKGAGASSVAYADLLGGPRYTLNGAAKTRGAIVLGAGTDLLFGGGLALGLDYQVQHTTKLDTNQAIKLTLTQSLDGKGNNFFNAMAVSATKPRDAQVDLGLMVDTNVTRARPVADRLADRIVSANISKSYFYDLSAHSRAQLTYSLGAEKFDRYDRLSRVSPGILGEVQYRGSAEFDAITFAAFLEANGLYLQSALRRGYRGSVGLSARSAITDRIGLFGALVHNERLGRSAVFDTKDNAAKIVLDYALNERTTLYVNGEYRRGDIVSTGRPSLENIEIAEVFVPDDAYASGQFFSYRFKGNTVLTTVGYNRALGSRHSFDLAWRRVLSTPQFRSSFISTGGSYVDDQYSIVYLIRF